MAWTSRWFSISRPVSAERAGAMAAMPAPMKKLDRYSHRIELAPHANGIAATRLEMGGDAFTFYLSGGVFQVVPWLVDALSRKLQSVAPRSDVQRLTQEPAAGAVWLALAEAHGGARIPRYKMANG